MKGRRARYATELQTQTYWPLRSQNLFEPHVDNQPTVYDATAFSAVQSSNHSYKQFTKHTVQFCGRFVVLYVSVQVVQYAFNERLVLKGAIWHFKIAKWSSTFSLQWQKWDYFFFSPGMEMFWRRVGLTQTFCWSQGRLEGEGDHTLFIDDVCEFVELYLSVSCMFSWQNCKVVTAHAMKTVGKMTA